MATCQVLSTGTERGKLLVNFTITDSAGKVHGPFVEHTRLTAEEFAAAKAAAWVEPVDLYAVLRGIILASSGEPAWEATRKALRDLNVEFVVLPGGQRIQTTYPEATDPEDPRAELQARVDAEAGAGKLDEIAAALRSALGVTDLVLERRSVVNLAG